MIDAIEQLTNKLNESPRKINGKDSLKISKYSKLTTEIARNTNKSGFED